MEELKDKPFALEELLLRVLEGDASRTEITSLNAALKDSAELRSVACRFLCDDSLISELHVSQKAVEVPATHLVGNLNSRAPGIAQHSGIARRVYDTANRHGAAIAAVAAVLLIGLFLHNYNLQTKLARLYSLAVVEEGDPHPAGKPGTSDLAEEESRREVIGRVSGLDDPVWTSGSAPLAFGAKVRRGDLLRLDSGVVELLLSTGAMVTIEGPAEFEATSALQSTLTQGKMAAAAPRVARGYTVFTPTAELVDIGTQFGVIVEESGDSELHVFDGDVVARSRLAPPGSDLLHAKQDQALRFDSASPSPRRLSARVRDFVRHAGVKYAAADLPAIPMTKNLQVWYAADRCEGVAEGESVGVWHDLLIGDNDFANNAWQFDEVRRPLLIRDAADRPALRFDGWSSCMATSPMDTVERQTMFIVCALAPISYANEHHGQMLLKYGDAPSLELSVLNNFKARGWVWPGADHSEVGQVLSKPMDSERIALVTYCYDSIDNVSKMWVNGVLQGSADAPVPVVQSGQTFLGSHFNVDLKAKLFGNLYEVAMFADTFDDEQLGSFWQYFSDRYGLE